MSLSPLRTISTSRIEDIVSALQYFEQYGSNISSYALLCCRAMYNYRIDIREITDSYLFLYKLALTWDGVKKAINFCPDPNMDKLIRKSIMSALAKEPNLLEQLEMDFEQAEQSCSLNKVLVKRAEKIYVDMINM